MAKQARKFYSPAEKSAFIAQVERLYRAGGRTYTSIARELGINETSYHSWVKQGFKPAPLSTPPATTPIAQRVFEPAERERLVAEVDRLRGQGRVVKAACRTAGISEKSYRTWKAATAPPLPMRVVEVTALVPTVATALTLLPPKSAPVNLAPSTPALTLLAPGGYRIEGLAVETAAALLRALS